MKPIAIGVLLFLGACAATPEVPPGEVNSELSHGYALLHELTSKQSGLARALILGGGMSDMAKTLIREIADTSKEAAKNIEALAEADPAITLGDTGLPAVEAGSREKIESAMTGRMLFAGKQFELRLLISQTDATEYGESLAKSLAELDDNTTRRDWLNAFGATYGAYRKRAEELLTTKGQAGAE